MQSWFQKILKSLSLPGQREHEGNDMQNNVSASASGSSQSTSCYSLSSSSSRITHSMTLHSRSVLSSPLRWSRRFDVFVCNSSVDSDIEEAGRLVLFLEASPRSLRCFLQHRDDCPGGAASTEFCNAVKDSHLWALLITPYFLQDEWCQYMMHQALAEGPMSKRLIPLVLNLSRSQYPLELKSIFSIDLSHDPVRGYTLLNNAVLHYLKHLKNETLETSMGSSSNDLSREENLMSNH